MKPVLLLSLVSRTFLTMPSELLSSLAAICSFGNLTSEMSSGLCSKRPSCPQSLPRLSSLCHLPPPPQKSTRPVFWRTHTVLMLFCSYRSDRKSLHTRYTWQHPPQSFMTCLAWTPKMRRLNGPRGALSPAESC